MNRPYSEATEGLVADAVAEATLSPAIGGTRRHARLVLDALFKAGLLLPEGAETRTEYGVETGPAYTGLVPPRQTYIVSHGTIEPKVPTGRVYSRLVTGWLPVDEQPDAVRLAVGDSNPSVQDPSVSVEETPQ